MGKKIITNQLIKEVRRLKEEKKYSITKIAKKTKISRNTVYKILKKELNYISVNGVLIKNPSIEDRNPNFIRVSKTTRPAEYFLLQSVSLLESYKKYEFIDLLKKVNNYEAEKNPLDDPIKKPVFEKFTTYDRLHFNFLRALRKSEYIDLIKQYMNMELTIIEFFSAYEYLGETIEDNLMIEYSEMLSSFNKNGEIYNYIMERPSQVPAIIGYLFWPLDNFIENLDKNISDNVYREKLKNITYEILLLLEQLPEDFHKIYR